MKSDNLVQLSGFLTKDVITNEKKSFAAFTIGRKVGEDTLYMNCIAFPNQKFKIPFDILAKGNYLKRKRKRIEKENEERRRQYQKEAKERELQRIFEQEKKAEEFIKNKSKYFDITFCNSNIIVVVLSSIDAYKKEGDTLHHCVFTNTYYDRKNSLILSARLIDTPDTPLETIELSLTDGHILQCYGSHNQETQYHNEIISLVNQHSHLILAA